MEKQEKKIISALINNQGYILSYLTVGVFNNGVFIEVPNHVQINELHNYKYIDGEFILLDDNDRYIINAPDTINQLKMNLCNTDYKILKYAEGQLTEEEYQQVKELRQSWRNEINQLENILGDRF